LREQYYGGVITRVDAVELPAFSQRVEAGIAPEDARDDGYSRDAALSVTLRRLQYKKSSQIGKVM
jgi:hypothetical protein